MPMRRWLDPTNLLALRRPGRHHTGSAELPDCRCGKPMHLASPEPKQERADAHVKVYKCGTCGHEFRLTIWAADAAV
jgi:hypothetical protein